MSPGTELAAVRAVGAALPADVLARVVDPKSGLPGRSADDYQLELGVTPVEAANRAWSVLTGAWAGYRAALERLPESDRATSLTRDKWLLVLLRELGFGRVPATSAGGIAAGDRSFPVSHESDPVPIHLLGRAIPLDVKTPGLAGAAERAPHAMVQDLLNRSHDHLWAIVANDSTLRLLRDSSTLVGQSYVEFDLAAIFDGELFADFTVLYLVCHHSRFQPTDDAGPGGCWLERWRTDAAETGARALGALRDGVKEAIEALGTGFLRHPANTELRDALAAGTLDLADVHRSLLRLVYRLLFLFVAEDRGLLLDPAADETAKTRYHEWFSTARLRHVARHRRGTRHDDQWQALGIVLDGLGQETGRPELGLPALGGIFENGPVDVTSTGALANEHLLAAVRHLSVIQPAGGGPRRVVDYRNLGAEELGGIYESLLEFVPRHDPHHRTFTLEALTGNDRKTSGAYYTPTSLIDCLLDSALDPLLDRAERDPDPEAALLALTVCDPACGSGHFLVAAAKRIAHRVARVRAEGAEPTIEQAQEAIHDVVARCIYGVDLNPMAAELAKVSLWLEALAAGRPLGFLDAHVKVGNALLGTTPALLAAGIPDEAFGALEGDDKKVVSSLKKQNKQERAGQGNLFAEASIPVDNKAIADEARQIDALAGLSLADIHLARQRQGQLESSPELRRARLLADTWCAAFVAPKQIGEPAITHGTLEAWTRTAPSDQAQSRQIVARLAAEYRFFHWHIEFPQVFASDLNARGPGWKGGFDCVLGNPPWERLKLQEQEFFASRDPEVSGAPNASARKRLIEALEETDPALFGAFRGAKRRAESVGHFVRASGRYPLTGRGDVNTYAAFAELDRSVLSASGRLGVIVPTGIATDSTTQYFFRDLVDRGALRSLYDFTTGEIWGQVGHNRFKFCLLTVSGVAIEDAAAIDFAFFLQHPRELTVKGTKYQLTPSEIRSMSPNTGTCPTFRTRRDAELALGVYDRTPVLIDEQDDEGNPWGAFYLRLVHYDDHRDLLRDEGPSHGLLPVYEAKMIHQFDHRWGDYALKSPESKALDLPDTPEASLKDANYRVTPRYWLDRSDFEAIVAKYDYDPEWFLAYRDVVRATDVRTVIASAIPRGPASVNVPVLGVRRGDYRESLLALLNSFVVDYLARQVVGGIHLTFSILKQLPIATPSMLAEVCSWSPEPAGEFLRARVLELTYTAWDLRGFAEDVRVDGPPFIWNRERGALLRAELDAAIFHIYGIRDRDDVDYILGTFPIVNRKDVAQYGEERTRRLILETFDAMTEAAMTGVPFVSMLDPPPGEGPRHDPREEL